jgi:hypothetical protein
LVEETDVESSDRLKRGHVREDGMILLRRRAGVEVWGTVEQYRNLINTQYKATTKKRLNYNNGTKFKIGYQDPDTGLYFIRVLGNYKPLFGTLEQLNEYRAKRRTIFEKYKIKKHKNPHIFKRGDWDPVLNLYFWKYNTQSGNPIWYNKEKFEARHNREKSATKARREKKKHGKA